MKSATGWQPFDGREGERSRAQRLMQPTLDRQQAFARPRQLGEAVKDDRDREVGIVRLASRAPRAAPRLGGIVTVDATWDDGTGYVAVTGEVGTHARRVECDTSVQAEVLALLLALEVAGAMKERPMTFCTDCQGVAYKVCDRAGGQRGDRLGALITMAIRALNDRRHWRVAHVGRNKVSEAHNLASQARRGLVAAPLWLP